MLFDRIATVPISTVNSIPEYDVVSEVCNSLLQGATPQAKAKQLADAGGFGMSDGKTCETISYTGVIANARKERYGEAVDDDDEQLYGRARPRALGDGESKVETRWTLNTAPALFQIGPSCTRRAPSWASSPRWRRGRATSRWTFRCRSARTSSDQSEFPSTCPRPRGWDLGSTVHGAAWTGRAGDSLAEAA